MCYIVRIHAERPRVTLRLRAAPLFKAAAPRKVCESPCYVLENAIESNWFHSHVFQRVNVDEKCYAQPPGPNYQ